MNERQRMQYMDAMGIEMFVPRFVLPHSLPPQQCPLPVARSATMSPPQSGSDTREMGVADTVVPQASLMGASSSIEVPPSVAPAIVEGAVDRILDRAQEPVKQEPEVEGRKAEEAMSAREALLRSIQAKPVSKLRFCLQMWRVSDRLFVIDSHRSGEALPTAALLTNILFLAKHLGAYLPKAETLHWPLVNDSDQDQGWEAAREMVAAFLESRLLKRPVQHFLLFGKEAFSSVLNADVEFEQYRYKTISVDAFSAEAIVLPSLADILYEPSCKADVWQALKPIIE